MNATSLYTFALTAACVGTYVGVRSLPVESCNFLHYSQFVNDQGAIEGCGYEEADFFDLTALRFPVVMEMRPLGLATLGEPVDVQLSLRTSTGRPIAWEDIATTHTQRLHLMIASAGLDDYQHVHPAPTGSPGVYSFRWIPRSAAPSRGYLDFVSLVSGKRTLATADLPSPRPAADASSLAPSAPQNLRIDVESSFQAGKDAVFSLSIPLSPGATFEPVMDAYAHVVAFAPGRLGFAHLHPLAFDWRGQDPAKPDLRFRFRPDAPGPYTFWAQVRVAGQDRFLATTVEVGP